MSQTKKFLLGIAGLVVTNYKSGQYDWCSYKEQLVEKEAKDSGDKAKEIYKYFESIW